MVVTSLMGYVEEFVLKALLFFACLVKNLITIVKHLFTGKIDIKDFLHQAARISYNAFPAVVIINIALGVVIAVQLAPQLINQGIGANLGYLATASLMKEVSPIVGCMMIATQYGTGTAAEIANMKITEQVDALKVFKIDPVEYLLAPRFAAAVLLIPLMIFTSAAIGSASTYVAAWWLEEIALSGFLSTIQSWLEIADINLCLIKSAIFGALMVLIAGTMGLGTRGGAKGVGKTTTQTVIVTFIAVVTVDYIIGAIVF